MLYLKVYRKLLKYIIIKQKKIITINDIQNLKLQTVGPFIKK